ncbi:unnamed protein product [Albugo candida]|uniref:Secreted protein n=1 Tax=Albugo candida TaxID=65357 RepID=A0A024GIL3_9STRA|nr:unnamed protein product [Albugo candida]|eukprot:CCI46600.1 unnamed protein product [Albugo candida]
MALKFLMLVLFLNEHSISIDCTIRSSTQFCMQRMVIPTEHLHSFFGEIRSKLFGPNDTKIGELRPSSLHLLHGLLVRIG